MSSEDHNIGAPETIAVGYVDHRPEEKAASDFALQILMPEDVFRAAVEEFSGNGIRIAQHFGVPAATVSHRASMLTTKGASEALSRLQHPNLTKHYEG